MGKLIILTFCILTFTFNSKGQNKLNSSEQIRKHIYVLCADSLEGRATGTIGQTRAANYIHNEFEKYNLTKLNNNSYKQFLELHKNHNNSITLKTEKQVLFSPWHFYFVSGFNQQTKENINITFAGYGTEQELTKLNATKNDICFVAYTPQSAIQTIKRIHKNHNTKNFFVVIPEKSKEIEKAWESDYILSKYAPPEAYNNRTLLKITEEWAMPTDSVNIFYGLNNSLKPLFNKTQIELVALANNYKYNNFSNTLNSKVECSINFNDSIEKISTENIIGKVIGKNPNQFIIVSAHYDHLGTELNDIYYGADDNASGTSVMMNLAERLSDYNKKQQLKRSIMFIGFTAEEMGLFGSEYYVKNPVISLDSTIVNINMDMVGRFDDKHKKHKSFVYILNGGLGKGKYFKLAKKGIEKPDNFKVSRNPGAYEKAVFTQGSDHYNFYKKNVPISVVFTGLHDDYHTPLDTPDKLNYKNMENISDLLFNYIIEIANNPEEYPVRFER